MLVGGAVWKAEAAQEIAGLLGHASACCMLPDLAAWGLALNELSTVIICHAACAADLQQRTGVAAFGIWKCSACGQVPSAFFTLPAAMAEAAQQMRNKQAFGYGRSSPEPSPAKVQESGTTSAERPSSMPSCGCSGKRTEQLQDQSAPVIVHCQPEKQGS